MSIQVKPSINIRSDTRRSAGSSRQPSLLILGCRGIPATHGGFETFAERLALFLVARGWHVAVYCQHDVATIDKRVWIETWHGIELINIAVTSTGPLATLEFDFHAVRDAARRGGTCLVLGYNSAAFLPYLRLSGSKIITNMDGIEWKRPKWSRSVRMWFWINEWIAAWSSHRLVADHPRIADHLATRRSRDAIATIAYGGDPIEKADTLPLADFGLETDRYLVSIARIEPDNSILTLVQAFSRYKRGFKLVILGKIDRGNRYHAEVLAAASDEVFFAGAIYDGRIVRCLRYHARAYLHGHTVGGTNPSLVESMWAGNVIVAHDNPFNRFTAGEEQFFFKDAESCDQALNTVLSGSKEVTQARVASIHRARRHYDWNFILEHYEEECTRVSRPRTAPIQRAAT